MSTPATLAIYSSVAVPRGFCVSQCMRCCIGIMILCLSTCRCAGYSVAPRRLGRLSAGRLFLPCDLLSCAVTRERVAGPNPELASEDTSLRMVSMEEDCSVSFGSVSPRSCHRIFGFNTARFFFLPVLRPFHTVEIFMAYSLCWATGLFSGSYIVDGAGSAIGVGDPLLGRQ